MSITIMVLTGSCGRGTQVEKHLSSTGNVALGWLQRSDLEKAEYQFQSHYDTLSLEEPLLPLLRVVGEGAVCVVVLGTWCKDSREEVPRFLRIADHMGMGVDRIRLYGVDRTKTSEDGVTDRYGITHVPTFIFFRGEREIGRIVERPKTTIEQEMLSILAAAQ
jgi:thiol-disulfide isomerase/thioredoxin